MLRSRMARPIHVWLPGLTLCALSACGGQADGFFSDVVGGATGANHAGAPSHAGSTSSGGNPGNAGNSGSAGTTASGGQVEAGGSASGGAHSGGAHSGGGGSGGRGGASSSGGASSGGASSSGGTGGSRAGAGGSGGSGGRAGAPGASAGSGGTSHEPTCDELLELAADQLEAARTCSAAASSPQCTSTVTNLCNCEVPVAKTAATDTKAYLATLKQIKEKDCPRVCPKIACTEVNSAQCQASGSGAVGTCVASHSGPQL